MPNAYTVALGKNLRAVRERLGLSLRAIEEKTGGTWKAVVVSSYERGDRNVTASRLAELCDFYRVEAADVMPSVAPNGTKYISYWEGDVQTEGGPAHFDQATGQIVLDGAPSVVAKTQK